MKEIMVNLLRPFLHAFKKKERKLELLIVVKATFHHCALGCVGNRLKECSCLKSYEL